MRTLEGIRYLINLDSAEIQQNFAGGVAPPDKVESKEKMICRGDLFYYDFGDNSGSVQSGERPVLVVQADDYNQNAPTIIVAAATSVIKKRYLPSHIILGEEFGLKKPSMVLLEQIQTVNREDLSEYIGTVDDDKLFRQINATLKKTFGLWVYKPEEKENIRCLCPKCLNDYIHNPNYIVRRLDPFAKRKDRCDKCDGYGWDYVVTDRYSLKKERIKKNITFHYGISPICLLKKLLLIPASVEINFIK